MNSLELDNSETMEKNLHFSTAVPLHELLAKYIFIASTTTLNLI